MPDQNIDARNDFVRCEGLGLHITFKKIWLKNFAGEKEKSSWFRYLLATMFPNG
jgi:hypothetical protein